MRFSLLTSVWKPPGSPTVESNHMLHASVFCLTGATRAHLQYHTTADAGAHNPCHFTASLRALFAPADGNNPPAFYCLFAEADAKNPLPFAASFGGLFSVANASNP
ncbi:hypothetical protein O181_046884 [Austropuccinia psidii MF-1]|uniref:Uncharacterized protein n=1 Tax=Austropuccinia psidii MF-1 TaxID=1389203 RepID=A0A9Q3DPT4_9BASI|nr:hypothetical protein [Austropuccinia psidii MF-1]